jgi:hypothetical protein
MVNAVSILLKRLRATWFGSVLAVVWLVCLIAAPFARHCIAIAAVKGGPSGVFCEWTPVIENPTGFGLFLLLLFGAVIVTLPLAFPYRPVLLLVGFGSAAIVVAIMLMSLDFGWYLAMSRLGLDITNEARSGFVVLLPASVAWMLAGFQAGRRSPSDARRPGRVGSSSPSQEQQKPA